MASDEHGSDSLAEPLAGSLGEDEGLRFLAVRRPSDAANRAHAEDEARAAEDVDSESYDGRRRMGEKAAATKAKLRVLSQFAFSRFAAESSTLDVRLRVYKSGDGIEHILRMSKPVDFAHWVEQAAHAFGFETCTLREPDAGVILTSSAAIELMLLDFASHELSRKMDVVTTWTERALGRLLDLHHTSQRVRGAHEVWELACRVENHGVLFEFSELFDTLRRALADDSFELRATAAAALFALAEVERTLEKMPVADMVDDLLCAATLPSNAEADGTQLVWIIGALNRLVQTPAGSAAYVAANGVRAVLPLVRLPQAEARRAAVILYGSSLQIPSLPIDSVLEMCTRAADMVAVATGDRDALPVRTMSAFVLARAIRRATLAGIALPQTLGALLCAQAGMIVAGMEASSHLLAELDSSADGAGAEEAQAGDARAGETRWEEVQAEALLEAFQHLLWSVCGCLAHLRTPLLLPASAMPALLALALTTSRPELGLIAAGILSLAQPADALAAAASEEGLCPRLLSRLELLVQRTRLSKRHELLGAAIANWCSISAEHNALQHADSLARALQLCALLQKKSLASGRPALKGLTLALHTWLAYTAMQLSAGDALSDSRISATATPHVVGLAQELMRSTRWGTLYGTACLFGLVRGSVCEQAKHQAVNRLVGDAGGVETLKDAFEQAMESGRADTPPHWEHAVAHLASASLWLLTYSEENATRLAHVGSELLMRVAHGQQKASVQVQTMCIGVLARLMRVHYLTQALMDSGAAGVLAMIGQSAGKTGMQRVLAASALDEVSQREEFRGELADATDLTMVSLVNSRGPEGPDCEEMQLIAARSLARVSFGGRKRKLLDIGATRELVKLAKSPVASVELRELALNALLNLSGEEKNQLLIARKLIFHLAAILYAPPSDLCAQHASAICSNLATNQANRGLMYRAELVLKHAIWANLDEIDPEAALEGHARERGSGGGQSDEEDFASPARALPRPKTRAAAKRLETKQRYIKWMEDLTAHPRAPKLIARLSPSSKASRLSPTAGPPSAESSGIDGSSPPSIRLERSSLGLGGRRLAGDVSLPQLMCKPFQESWRLPGQAGRRTAHAPHALPRGYERSNFGSSSTKSSLASASHRLLPPLSARPHTALLGAEPHASGMSNSRPFTAAQQSLPLAEEEAEDGEETPLRAAAEDASGEPETAGETASERELAGDNGGGEGGGADVLILNDPSAALQMAAGAGEDALAAAIRYQRGATLGHVPSVDASDDGRHLRSSSQLLGVEESKLAFVHERWYPPVVDVDVQQAEGAETAGKDIASRARALRSKDGDKRLTIKLDPALEYASKWRFEPHDAFALGSRVPGPNDPLPLQEQDPRASMVMWRSREGSRYSQGLFAHIPLPDGELAHVYYTGRKKNAVDPGPMPTPPIPTALRDFGIDSLPLKPLSMPPGEGDVSVSKVRLSLSCPMPSEHKLPVEDVHVWYGTVPNALPLLDVEARTLVDLRAKEGRNGPYIKPWTVDDSLFAPRKKYTDAHSYWNSEKTTQRAFEIDWARMNQERFRILIDREDDTGGDDEMMEVKAVLNKHRDLVYTAFMWYGSGPGASVGAQSACCCGVPRARARKRSSLRPHLYPPLLQVCYH